MDVLARVNGVLAANRSNAVARLTEAFGCGMVYSPIVESAALQSEGRVAPGSETTTKKQIEKRASSGVKITPDMGSSTGKHTTKRIERSTESRTGPTTTRTETNKENKCGTISE